MDLNGIWCNFETCWFDKACFHSIFHPFNIQGRKPYLYDFIKINFNFGFYSNTYRPISFKLDRMIETTKFYILISVWITLTCSQGHICMRNLDLDLDIYIAEANQWL